MKTEDGKTVLISQDEGIRGDTTLAGLSKLKPSFKEGGSTTAGTPPFPPFSSLCLSQTNALQIL